MLSYDEFKTYVQTELKNYLPKEYAFHQLVETKIHKINRSVDTFRLQPPGPVSSISAMATLNYQDMYQNIVRGADPCKVLLYIAQTLQYRLPLEVEKNCHLLEEDASPDPDDLHVALINTERNRELLKNVPHHDFLDLSAIAVLEEGKATGYICVVTDEVQKALGMDTETMLKTACSNTFRDYPAVLEQSHLGLNAWCEGSPFGAVCLLDEEMLKEAAETLDSDLYVMPDSLHLLFIIAVKNVPRRIITECARKAALLEPDAFDYLSENVYYYSRRDGSLRIISEKSGMVS